MRSQVDDHEIELRRRSLPLDDDKVLRRVIVRPADGLNDGGVPVTDRSAFEGGEHLLVHGEDSGIDGFVRPASKLHGNLKLPTLKLALVKKSHSGKAEHE